MSHAAGTQPSPTQPVATPSAPEDETLYSLERASAVLLVLAGMALQWASFHSITLLDTVFRSAGVTISPMAWTLHSVCTFAVFAVLFLAARRLPSLLEHRMAIPLVGAFLAMGMATLGLGVFIVPSQALILAGNTLLALGTTPLIVLWGEVYRYLNPQNEQLVVTLGAIVLSVTMYMVEIQLPQPLVELVFISLPLASLGCLAAARNVFANLTKTWTSSARVARRKSPAMLFVCIVIFSVPYDYLRGSIELQTLVAGDLGPWTQVLSVVVVALTLAALAEYAAERRGILLVPSLVLGLLTAALVASLLPGATSGPWVPGLLYAGYYLFLAMVYLALGPIVAQTSTNPVRLFSGAMLANVGGLLIGTLLGNLAGPLGERATTMLALGITYTVFIVGLILFNSQSYSIFRINYFDGHEYSFEYQVPVVPLGAQALAAASPQAEHASPDERMQSMLDAIAAQCAALSSEAGLSSREAEVLVELARGRTLSSIAATFVVSENTIKAHTKSIYRKLDVHTREELLHRIEQAGE